MAKKRSVLGMLLTIVGLLVFIVGAYFFMETGSKKELTDWMKVARYALAAGGLILLVAGACMCARAAKPRRKPKAQSPAEEEQKT